ncbi:MAG: TonB-dependent receptor [Bacteroidia bacterium]
MNRISNIPLWAYLITFFFKSSLVYGQSLPDTLVGKVIDTNGHPLSAVEIYIEGPNVGTLTDTNGVFRIAIPAPYPTTLHGRYLGYKPQFIQLSAQHSPLDTVVMVLKPTSHTLGEVLIEGDLGLLTWQSGQSTEQLKTEDLRREGGITMMQALERLPGITQMQTGIGLAKPVIRGMSFQRVAVTDGNMRQEGQQWGVDHGLEVDPFQIDEVRIVKGPSGLLYGSDAMVGVVQLVAKPITPKNTLEGNMSLIGRSVNDHLGGHLSLQGVLSRNWSWSVRATGHRFSDYRLPADSFSYNRFRMPLPGRRLENTAGREMHGAFGLMHRFAQGTTQINYKRFEQNIGFFPGAIGRPLGYKLDPNAKPTDVLNPKQLIVHHRLGWHTDMIGDLGDWEIDLGGQYNDRRELSNPQAHGREYLDSNQQLSHGMWLGTASWNIRFQPHQHGSSRWLVGSSGQLQQNQIGGYEFLIPEYKSAQYGLFVVRNSSPAQNWKVSTGIRTDISRQMSRSYTDRFQSDSGIVERLRAPALQRHYLSTTASAGIGWSNLHGNAFNVHVGNSFRLPGLPELASNGVHHGSFRHEQGDSSLRPEQGWQLDLGGERRMGRLTCKGSTYFNYFSRYIYLRPTGLFSFLPEGGQIFRYTQGRVVHLGGEAQVDFRFGRSNTITVVGEYVWMQNVSTGVPLPWSPPPSLWMSWNKTISRSNAPANATKRTSTSYFNIDWILVAAQKRTDRNELPTPGYNLVQSQAGWSIPVDDHRTLTIRLQAQNLLNRPYLNHLSRYRLIQLPEPGRNLQVIVSLEF